MSNQTRILIVEDLQSDFELAQLEIRKSVEGCAFQQVETRQDFLNALENFQPDVILSDYSLPQFDGMAALKLSKEIAPLTPFIIWTGSMSENIAVECMRAGANNYILKENLKRLGPAILHSIHERQLLLERNQGEEKLRRSEARFSTIFENSPVAIGISRLNDGRIIHANPAFATLFGFTREEMLDHTAEELNIMAGPDGRGYFIGKLQIEKHVRNLEVTARLRSGEKRQVIVSGEQIEIDGEPCLMVQILDITERKLAEQRSQVSEERFRSLIENSLDNISLLTSNGVLLWENPAVNRTLGYKHDEFVDRNIFKLMHPDDVAWTADLFTTVTQKPGSQQRGTFRLMHHDGTWRWIEATATNMLDNSSVNAVVINYRDVTERKLAEIKIQQQNADLQLINAINEMALRDASLDEIVSLLAKELKRIFNSSGSTLYTLNPDGTTLMMQQYFLPPEIARRVEKIIGSTIPLIHLPIRENSFFHKTLSSQHGSIINDREEIENWMAEFINTPFLPNIAREPLRKLIPQIYDYLNIKSAIVIPLMLNGKTIGILDISNPGMFTENDLERIENISRQLTAAIQRQQAGKNIQRSEAFLQSVQNALSASIAILNEEGVIVQVNAAWRKFGEQNGLQHPKYCVGLNYLSICDSTTGADARVAAQAAQLIREIIAGKRQEAQLEYPCHSPEEKRWFVVRITKFDDGERIWVVLAHENISEQKKAAAQVAHQAHLLSNIHDAVVSFDKDFMIISWNHAAEKLYGWKSEEVVGKFSSEVLPANFLETTQEKAIEQLKSAGQFQAEVIHTRKDGAQINIETRISSLINQDDELVYVAVNRDITERKKTEQSLKETSEQFQTLFEASPDAILLIEPRGEWPIVDCNTAACQMNGYTRDELIGQPIRIVNVSPDSDAGRSQYLEKIRASSILQYEDQHQRKDGTVFPIEVSTSLITVGGREMVLGIDRDITERKQAEEALREGERRYHALFEEMPVAVWEEDYSKIKKHLDVLKQQGITNFREYFSTHPDALARCIQMIGISDVNHTAVQMFEAAGKQELITTTLEESSEGEREHNIEDILAIAEGKVSNSWEGADTTCKGRPIIINLSWSVVPGYESSYSRVITTTIDITDRKRMEAAEREQRALAEALRDTAETLNSTLDYGEVLDHILAAVEKVVPHDAGTIMLIDGEIAQVVRSVGYDKRGLNAKITGVKIPVRDADNLRQILETRQPLIVYDTHSYTGWKRLPTTEWLRSNVGAPISIHGNVIGFILLDSETVGFFTNVHAERLKAFADQAAIAIQNARLLQKAQEEIAERKQAEDSLRRSESLLVEAQRIGHIGHIVWNRDNNKMSCSDELYDILELPHGTRLSFETLAEMMHPEEKARLNALDRDVFSRGDNLDYEYRIYTATGKERLLHQRGNVTFNEKGVPVQMLAVVQDITERKQAEAQVKELLTFNEKILDNSPVGILAYKQTGECIFANSTAAAIVGTTIETLRSQNYHELDSWKQSGLYELAENAMAGSEALISDIRLVSTYGKESWLTVHCVKFISNEKNHLLILVTDITERKQAEQELFASEERFRQMADNIQEVFWITDASTGVDLYLSPAYESIWGRPAEVQYQDPQAFIRSILPEDRSFVTKMLETQRKGISTEMEYRIRRTDSSVRWIWDRAFPIHDKSGNLTRLAGIAADITERKQVQDDLRESEVRYRGLFENLVIGFALHEIVTDEEGTPVDYVFLEINPMFEKLTGIKAKEVVGRRATEVLPNLENERFISIYGKVALTGEPAHLEEFSRDLNRYYDINAYSPKQGQFAVTFIDITERKKADEELRKLSRAVEQSASTIVITDTTGAIEYANPKFTETTGYTFEEARMQNPRILKSDFTTPEEYEHLWQIIASGEEWHGEFMNKKKNGELYWEAATITPIFNERKEITHFLAIKENITERKHSEADAQRHISELEALYENGLALGRLLNPREIGERIITTFARHLSWHHVAIRLLQPGSDILELIAFNIPDTNQETRSNSEYRFQFISRLGQGLSGWVAQTGKPFRTGNVHQSPQYIDTYAGIESGLYMPLKIGDQVLGVISVESEKSNAFTPQDERLLATLANQAAVAFENARLYQTNQQERERFSELFENTPVATWLEDFSEVIAWMNTLRDDGVDNLREHLENHLEQYRLGISLIDIVDVNHAAIVMNGARNKEELMGKVHELMMEETPSPVMMNELDLIWKGYTSFGFEISSRKLDDSIITGIQRIYIPTSNNEPDYRRVIVTSTDITERVGFEQQLRASEVHYRELADSITDIFFELDQNLCYSHWNKASETLTGISAKNAIGRKMTDVFGDTEDQKRIGAIYREVLENHRPHAFETMLLIHDMPRNFEINAYPSTRGVAVVAKDVTERKRAESLMQKRFELMEYSSEHSLEALMQKTLNELSSWSHSAIGSFQLMKEDENTPAVQVWSTNAFSDFHSSQAEIMHKPADQAGVWAEAVRQRRAIIHNDYTSLPEKKGLSEEHASLIRELVVPIIRNEKIMAVIGVGNKSQDYNRDDLEITERFADYAWDIIERKQMVIEIAEERNQLAKRVEERTSDLSRANSNLARALRVKDEFLANMSHELRTPLNAILGLSESLSEQTAGPLNEKQQKYLTTISESGHHLLSLINDILDLAKIEAGQITLDINKVDVNSVSQASLRMTKQLAQKKNLEVLVDIDNEIGLMWADERRLKQMIVNLLSNAVKFTPEGGKIGLQITGDQDDNKVMITVWDTGIGIKEEDFERLFQPFVQLDAGLARESSGTGLGLALVAQMARLHGGSIRVESNASKGSRFTIVLPWEPALTADTVERMKVTGKFNAIGPSQIQQTILLIEDTQEVVMMIKDYLEIAGYAVATAQDGMDGITQAKFHHPDLILMDVQMPRMDGLEATKKLRQDPEFKHTPIIALTALAMPNDRERCIEAGMDEYISKPVNLRGLVKLIQNYLSMREEKTQPR